MWHGSRREECGLFLRRWAGAPRSELGGAGGSLELAGCLEPILARLRGAGGSPEEAAVEAQLGAGGGCGRVRPLGVCGWLPGLPRPIDHACSALLPLGQPPPPPTFAGARQEKGPGKRHHNCCITNGFLLMGPVGSLSRLRKALPPPTPRSLHGFPTASYFCLRT